MMVETEVSAFSDDEVSVSGLVKSTDIEKYYTLDGRPIQGLSIHKGLFIRNGRKFIIK